MFEELTIDHFRGIQSLEISNLSRLNLIVGTNGSGKSTLLDSLFLIINPLNTRLIANANIFRGYQAHEKNFFTSFFYSLSDNYNINIHASLKNGSERNLTVSPRYNSDESDDYNYEIELEDIASGLNQETTEEHDHIPGVNLEYRNSNFQGVLKSWIKNVEGEFKFKHPQDLKEEFKGVYLSNNIYQGSANRLDSVIVNKDLDYVIKALNIIEDSITDLRLTNNGMIYCDLGHKRLLPSNVMGDGFQRLLAILLALYDAKNGILLIDEIENGIYYSKFPEVWNVIYKAARDFNVQVFATTHSIECIESFSSISLDSELFQNETELNLYRIEEKSEKHKITYYNRELLKTSLERGFEIR